MGAHTLADRAIRWYDASARDLPWRHPETTPWGVLVSEMMLQQTPVSRVTPVYEQWLHRWPSPKDLAADAPGEAIRAWGRLGYPRRALRLHACAVVLVAGHQGTVPDDLALLLDLPGVGTYTARAVAAFAFGQRQPVVDTNVRRLIARAYGGRPDGGMATSMADLVTVEGLLPKLPSRAARASAAFMELGAVLCSARSPDCEHCPLRTVCVWRLAGRPQAAYEPRRRSQGYAGTDRQVRGLILAVARQASVPVPRAAIDALWADPVQLDRCVVGLLTDGLLVRAATDTYALPT